MEAGARRSLDDLVASAGLAPEDGFQAVAARGLPAVAFDPSLPLLVLRGGADGTATLPGRHARGGPMAVLRALYPDAHAVRRLSDESSLTLAEITEEELAADDWLIPPLAPADNLASPHGMAAISARLRAPDGCPWDRKQTHASLRPFVLEEAYETVDAIERGVPADLAEELGDLLLQIILHAQLAAEERSEERRVGK